MKVIEIFNSIEGEGLRAGKLATFIRFEGCNCRCSYCDTKYSYENSIFIDMSLNEILFKIKKIGNNLLTITGGEPLIHDNIEDFIEILNREKYKINIETNGTVPINFLLKYENVFITSDYKCPSSNMEDKMNLDNLKILRNSDVLKFVVGDYADLLKMNDIIKKYNIVCNIYISPVFGKIEYKEIIEFMKKNRKNLNMDNVTFKLQLHKIIWNKDERGV